MEKAIPAFIVRRGNGFGADGAFTVAAVVAFTVTIIAGVFNAYAIFFGAFTFTFASLIVATFAHATGAGYKKACYLFIGIYGLLVVSMAVFFFAVRPL